MPLDWHGKSWNPAAARTPSADGAGGAKRWRLATHVGSGLRGVPLGSRHAFAQVVQHHFIQMPHRRELEVPEVRSQIVPQCAFAAIFLPDGLEQLAAALLSLVNQKG